MAVKVEVGVDSVDEPKDSTSASNQNQKKLNKNLSEDFKTFLISNLRDPDVEVFSSLETSQRFFQPCDLVVPVDVVGQ